VGQPAAASGKQEAVDEDGEGSDDDVMILDDRFVPKFSSKRQPVLILPHTKRKQPAYSAGTRKSPRHRR